MGADATQKHIAVANPIIFVYKTVIAVTETYPCNDGLRQ